MNAIFQLNSKTDFFSDTFLYNFFAFGVKKSLLKSVHVFYPYIHFVHMYIHTYVHTDVYTYIRTYIPIYIHTYILI